MSTECDKTSKMITVTLTAVITVCPAALIKLVTGYFINPKATLNYFFFMYVHHIPNECKFDSPFSCFFKHIHAYEWEIFFILTDLQENSN